VAQANTTAGADTIGFSSGVEGRQLSLTQGQLSISSNVAIDGDGNNDGLEVTIAGAGNSRLLTISGGATTVSLDDLTLADGRAANGEPGGGRCSSAAAA
jgi:hypothetical protein